jgi:hypothetical protein
MGTGAGSVSAVTGEWWHPATAAQVAPLLGHRRWWRHRTPFPHVRAVNVFSPEVYLALEQAFGAWLADTGGGAALAHHDLSGATVTASFEGPLRLFASPGWRELVSRALGVPVTRYVNVGLHHHRPWCDSGFPHTDLNPGWFPVDGGEPGRPPPVVLADPRVGYTTGASTDGSLRPVRVVRAVALLFYLANPPWQPQHGNCTGLYRSGRDDPGDPVAVVPPHSNSLLAFECTPWSFHGFVSGGPVPRSSVVQWFHRRPEAVLRRWGRGVVTGYAGGGG